MRRKNPATKSARWKLFQLLTLTNPLLLLRSIELLEAQRQGGKMGGGGFAKGV